MTVDDCYQLGYLSKTHGLKGELQLTMDVDYPEEYTNLESMFVLRNKTLVPFFLERIHIKGKRALLKIEEVDSIDQAQELISCEVYLPLSFLPELNEGQFYFHELIGFELFDLKTLIGQVKNIYTTSPQILIEVDHNGIEVLVPLNDEIIKRVDKEQRKVFAELPDGLLDVYLDSNEN